MFQSALRMRGLFNQSCGRASNARRDAFQSALRMRGLFNVFALLYTERRACFNPPCGCVAFSTKRPRSPQQRSGRFQSALRMRGLFNSDRGSQVRGGSGFNPPCGCVAFSTAAPAGHRAAAGAVSIRLADAWPFQPAEIALIQLVHEVSIRLADAWPFQLVTNRRLCRSTGSFNPPCGCVAFSTWWRASCAPNILSCFNPPCGCVAFSTATVC